MKRILLAAALSILPTLALAQSNCGPYAGIEKQLSEGYSETVVNRGLASNGQSLVVLFLSPSGTFTLLAVSPNGIACLLATGDNWEAVAPAAPGKGA